MPYSSDWGNGVAYVMCILPIGILRVMGLKAEAVPEPVWIFAMSFLYSLGESKLVALNSS